MLLGESLFNSFSYTPGIPSTTLPNLDMDVAPKLDNSDPIFDQVFGEMEYPDEQQIVIPNNTITPIAVHSSILESAFENDTAPMFNSLDDSIDLKSIFADSASTNEVENDLVKSEEDLESELFNLLPQSSLVENRSKSTPASYLQPISPVNEEINDKKRSFSVSGVSSEEAENDSDCSEFRKDKLGCTPYTRKQRNLPLEPVVPKGDDLASLKRARNTEAARRSRARKMQRMSQLESKCEGLIKENDDLKAQIKALKSLLGQ